MSTSNGKITIRFWGVRGGIPTPDQATSRFGGNTPCIEMRCGDRLLIFDAGTGIRPLGAALDQSQPIEADIFFSNTRFEHTCGLPFFTPGYNPSNAFTVWGGAPNGHAGVEEALTNMMTSPLFPIPLSFIGGLKAWRDIGNGASLAPHDGIAIRSACLCRMQAATCYRVEFAGHAVCYITAPVDAVADNDSALLALADQADLVILHAHFLNVEARRRPSLVPWEEGVRLCDAAGAARLILFAHHPDQDDVRLDGIEARLSARRAGSAVAREGLTVTV